MSLGTDSTLNSIIHPDLHRSLARAYPAYVTVQVATESKAEDHSIQESWSDIPQLRGLRGSLASIGAASAQEIRRLALTNVKTTHVLDLQSYRPEILPTHRVLASRAMGETAVVYNITGVRHDSQGRSTRLELEVVSH